MPVCQLCKREVSKTTRHHLIPKQKGGKEKQVVELCKPCHKMIHATFTNSDLVQEYNTVEKLKNAPELQDYLEWISERDLENINVRRRKDK